MAGRTKRNRPALMLALALAAGVLATHAPVQAAPSRGASPVVTPTMYDGVNLDDWNIASQPFALVDHLHLRVARIAWTDPPTLGYQPPRLTIQRLAQHHVQILDLLYACSVPNDRTRLSLNKARMADLHRLVGARTSVWWEFGNEPSVFCHGYYPPVGMSSAAPQSYTVMWKRDIPQLRRLYPQDRFGGPSNIGDPAYVAYFADHADTYYNETEKVDEYWPLGRPDFLSWHYYAGYGTEPVSNLRYGSYAWASFIAYQRQYLCSHTNPFEVGEQRVEHHFNCQARTGPTVIQPAIISEWGYGYAARCGPSDHMHTDAAAMRDFAIGAMRSFKAARVLAAFMFDTGCKEPPENFASVLHNNGRLTNTGWVLFTFH